MNTLGRYAVILLGLLTGAISLSLFSILQKSIMGFQLSWNGFIIPLAYGGAIGIVISLYILRSKRLHREIAQKEQEMHNKVLMSRIRSEEQERSRLGRELHDGLGPIISSVKMYFQLLSTVNDEEKRKIIIDNGNESLKEAVSSLREISSNLNPYVLTQFGLDEAIRKFIKKFEVNYSINCSCDIQLSGRLPSELEVTIYRTCTELINNSLKHSNATEIKVFLTNDDNRGVVFRYSDNGKGFDLEAAKENPKGLGLYNIRNRIRAMGGSSEMKTAPGSGFTFSTLLPVTKG